MKIHLHIEENVLIEALRIIHEREITDRDRLMVDKRSKATRVCIMAALMESVTRDIEAASGHVPALLQPQAG